MGGNVENVKSKIFNVSSVKAINLNKIFSPSYNRYLPPLEGVTSARHRMSLNISRMSFHDSGLSLEKLLLNELPQLQGEPSRLNNEPPRLQI
jgi:hypothetical protein